MKKIIIVIVSVLVLPIFAFNTLALSSKEKPHAESEQIATIMKADKRSKNTITKSEDIDNVGIKSYKPSREEISNLDIPLKIDDEIKIYSPTTTDSKTEYIATVDSETKNIRAWHTTQKNDILISETTYNEGINVIDYTKTVKSWFSNKSVEELTIKEQVAILHEPDSGICELQIITDKKLFTIAGADRETVLKIAEKINF